MRQEVTSSDAQILGVAAVTVPCEQLQIVIVLDGPVAELACVAELLQSHTVERILTKRIDAGVRGGLTVRRTPEIKWIELEITYLGHHVASAALERAQHELVVADDVTDRHVVEPISRYQRSARTTVSAPPTSN